MSLMGTPSRVGVLVSGGLDSSVLLAELARRYNQVWPIYIRQGLRWESAEIYWLRRFLRQIHARSLRPLQVFSLPMGDLYGSHWSTGKRKVPGAQSRDTAVYLPGRNMILSVKAAVFCSLHKIPELALGSLDGNPFADAAPKFFKRWGQALSTGLRHPLRLVAPYRHLSKAEVIRRGRAWPLELTFSCIAPRGRRHCGRCNKCAERRRAFRQAGIKDPTRYA
jgi:7-cyano-7-deazaguanine synthase